ncbi:MAG: glutathione peroxidase [Planctomycetaceae bacterium]|nr:glutathione peroxidase [Planctomycetaceae bacterium]
MAADSVHEFTVKSIDGKDVDMSQYKGKVLMIVNVASKCGATPQYEQLQALNEKYGEKGLVVLGFPCNQFGMQEPGTAEEIKSFCSSTYDVTFPLFTKINVKGDDQAPIYKYLTEHAEDTAAVGWNFEKFIVGKDGKVAGRFKTRTSPDAPAVVKLLESELAK